MVYSYHGVAIFLLVIESLS